MIHWFNAKFAGSCWFCRAGIFRGEKVAHYRGPSPGGSWKTICRPCGNAYQARMAQSEEARRGAYAADMATRERES